MLAESWEPNDDLTSYTFHLRKDVKFHHGKEFKAEDVIFSVNRLFEVESPLASVMVKPAAMIAVDDHTVRTITFQVGTDDPCPSTNCPRKTRWRKKNGRVGDARRCLLVLPATLAESLPYADWAQPAFRTRLLFREIGLEGWNLVQPRTGQCQRQKHRFCAASGRNGGRFALRHGARISSITKVPVRSSYLVAIPHDRGCRRDRSS